MQLVFPFVNNRITSLPIKIYIVNIISFTSCKRITSFQTAIKLVITPIKISKIIMCRSIGHSKRMIAVIM